MPMADLHLTLNSPSLDCVIDLGEYLSIGSSLTTPKITVTTKKPKPKPKPPQKLKFNIKYADKPVGKIHGKGKIINVKVHGLNGK
jgi:hypothetical protein